jgi:hypothetical protein
LGKVGFSPEKAQNIKLVSIKGTDDQEQSNASLSSSDMMLKDFFETTKYLGIGDVIMLSRMNGGKEWSSQEYIVKEINGENEENVKSPNIFSVSSSLVLTAGMHNLMITTLNFKKVS